VRDPSGHLPQGVQALLFHGLVLGPLEVRQGRLQFAIFFLQVPRAQVNLPFERGADGDGQ